MIDLHARAISDSRKILNNELGTGGFAVELTFTNPDDADNPLTISGFYNDTALLGINPETGLPVRGSKIAISFHQSDLTIWNGLDDLQRWTAAFVNGAGQDVLVELNDIIPDRSFGEVLVMCTLVSGTIDFPLVTSEDDPVVTSEDDQIITQEFR